MSKSELLSAVSERSNSCESVLDLPSGDKIYTYTCSGTFTMPMGFDDAEVLIVAGGGGGGYGTGAGGGGAGGVVYVASMNLTEGQSYSVTVGQGGAGGTSNIIRDYSGRNGGASVFNSQTAIGGGGGGSGEEGLLFRTGKNGGSGGGSGTDASAFGGSGTGGQGNDGGGGAGNGQHAGGGGGGAGSVGESRKNNDGGNGGEGVMYTISNAEVWYAAGGGSTARKDDNSSASKQGLGGSGIGGDGNNRGNGGAGAANTGSGGGGSRAHIGGRGGDGIVIIRISARLTPVKWSGFAAEYSSSKKAVQLDWSTLKEWESSHFEIERSVEGFSDFVKVGEIDAAGWSDQLVEYSYEDLDLSFGKDRAYYRIKQVDLDGSFEYSKVLMVKVPVKSAVQTGVWKAYPNPTTGSQLRVDLNAMGSYQGGNVSFKVFNGLNSSDVVTVSSARELNPKIAEVVQGFSAGLLVIELAWEGKVEYLKVIKQ
ncbi:hypothetical protein GCM10028791_29840 [Echinicola sediminis]